MSSILYVFTARQTNVAVLSRVALKRLTILVLSLESGTKLIDGGASVAVWRKRAGVSVRREIGCKEAKPKQLQIAKVSKRAEYPCAAVEHCSFPVKAFELPDQEMAGAAARRTVWIGRGLALPACVDGDVLQDKKFCLRNVSVPSIDISRPDAVKP
jgi:hypothetical protein